MKKVFILFVIVGIFSSCSGGYQKVDDMEPGEATIVNNSVSGFDVTYDFGTSSNLIRDGFLIESGDPPHEFPREELYAHVTDYKNKKRVSLKTEYLNDNDIKCTFEDLTSYNVRVKNYLGKNATLSADGWMDVMEDILPTYNDDANHNGKIYTDEPTFTATTDAGTVTVLDEDIEYIFKGNTFIVTLGSSVSP